MEEIWGEVKRLENAVWVNCVSYKCTCAEIDKKSKSEKLKNKRKSKYGNINRCLTDFSITVLATVLGSI